MVGVRDVRGVLVAGVSWILEEVVAGAVLEEALTPPSSDGAGEIRSSSEDVQGLMQSLFTAFL